MYNIQLEKCLAQKYLLTKDPMNHGLVALTQDNVARIEAILCIDSNYRKSGDATACPLIGEYKKDSKNHKKGDNYISYGGSTAYWLIQLKKHLDNGLVTFDKNLFEGLPESIMEQWSVLFMKDVLKVRNNSAEEYSLEVAIYGTVSAIDRENSTHLTSDQNSNKKGNGRIELTKRILKIWGSIERHLRQRHFSLICYLSKKTNNGQGRENYSFATKFCHYACYYWFYGQPEQDNYSICDNVLRKAVAEYANVYGLHKHLNQGKEFTEKDFANYSLYSEVIDELRNKYGENISRNGFDHLLWYYHKSGDFDDSETPDKE